MKTAQQTISRTATTTAKQPIKVKEKGLDAQLNHLARQLGVTLKELAPLLQLSESTLHRLRRQTTLTGSTAERVDLLWAIIQHGLRVYEGMRLPFRTGSATRWLNWMVVHPYTR